MALNGGQERSGEVASQHEMLLRIARRRAIGEIRLELVNRLPSAKAKRRLRGRVLHGCSPGRLATEPTEQSALRAPQRTGRGRSSQGLHEPPRDNRRRACPEN